MVITNQTSGFCCSTWHTSQHGHALTYSHSLSQPSHLVLERLHAWKVRSSHVALQFCGCVIYCTWSRSCTEQVAGEHLLLYTGRSSLPQTVTTSCMTRVAGTVCMIHYKTKRRNVNASARPAECITLPAPDSTLTAL